MNSRQDLPRRLLPRIGQTALILPHLALVNPDKRRKLRHVDEVKIVEEGGHIVRVGNLDVIKAHIVHAFLFRHPTAKEERRT